MGGYGWLWVVMGGYGWLWVIMGGFGWFMGGFGWLCVFMGGYGWLWVVMCSYGWLWVVMGGHWWVWVVLGCYGFCSECGGIVCFAYSTYSVSAKNPVELSEKLSNKILVIANYLRENRLCNNTDKTHILVLCTEQKRRHIDTESVVLTTVTEEIIPSQVENLLGFTVHQNLCFGECLIHGKSSVLRSLTKKNWSN